MGRSRSRRRRESSSSSSSSDSEDSEDERQREEERRAAKAARRAQRKAEQERREAEAAALLIMARIPYAIKDEINSYEQDEEDAQDEDDGILEDTVELCARKPSSAPAGVVDMSDWAKAEQYLRKHFEVHDSVKKPALVLQYFEPGDSTTPKLYASPSLKPHSIRVPSHRMPCPPCALPTP